MSNKKCQKAYFKKLSIFIAFTMVISIFIVIPVNNVSAAVQATYYVDPENGNDNNNGTSTTSSFRTIEKAKTVVDGINGNMTGDIYVYLRGGVYYLTDPINFVSGDSGTNGFKIYYKAYENEEPVISGGKKLTDWTLYDSNKNIYKKAYGSDIETRQLFVNGVRATRAKNSGGLPDNSYYTITSSTDTYRNPYNKVWLGHYTSWTDMVNWGNKSDIEIVYQIQWTNPRCGVEDIVTDGSNAKIIMKQPGFFYCTNKASTSVGSSSYPTTIKWVENAYELLDEEGEWYLDRSTDTFYYKPRSGEDMSTAEVIVPTLENLIKFESASSSSPVSNIEFYGVSFKDSTWLRPNGSNGFPDAQNGVIRERFLVEATPSYNDYPKYAEFIDEKAAVLFKNYVRSVKFERCNFANLGYIGILMLKGSQDNSVTGCTFNDISAQGVQVGGDDYHRGYSDNYNPTDDYKKLRNNDVSNCYFINCAVEYNSAAAIGASYPIDIDIIHNEIVNSPYSAIHFGWGWNYHTGITQNNKIDNNFINGTMKVLKDGGAIYALGNTSGNANLKSSISNNYLKSQKNEYGSIYPDEGSDWYDISNNVIENTPRWIHMWTGTVNDITVDNNYTTTSTLTNNGTNCTVTNTHVDASANWPLEAQNIISDAGLQSQYQDIKLIIPSPTPVPVNFTDDFNDGNADLWTAIDGTWSVSNNEYVQTNIPGVGISVAGDLNWTDYALSAKVKNVNNGTRSVGLIARYQDDLNYYFCVYERTDGVWRLYKRVNNSNTQLGSDYAQSWTNDTYKTVKLVVKGTSIKLNVDGSDIIGPVTDSALSSGKIGLRTYNNEGAFDDITAKTYVVDENFNSMATGSAPTNWICNEYGGTLTVEEIPSISNKSFKAYKSATSGTSMTAYKSFECSMTSGAIETSARAEQSDDFCYAIIAKDSSDTSAIQIGFGSNGKIQYRNGNGWNDTDITYSADTWYDFKVVFNTDTNTYDFYVNDILKVSGVSFMTNVSNIAKTGVGIAYSAVGAAYFDNIKVY